MKTLIRYFILGIVLSLLPVPTYAQSEGEQKRKLGKMDVPEETEGERERREEAERRKEEAEDNARLWPEAEGIGRRAEDAFLEGIFTDPRDLKEAREHYNRKMRLDSFLKDVDNKFRRVRRGTAGLRVLSHV